MSDARTLTDVLHRAVSTADARMTEENQIGQRIAARTQGIIRGVVLLLVIAAAINLYLIQDLAQGMRSMTANMESMYDHFSSVSGDMHHITAAVTAMNVQVRSLPGMREDMVLISQDMTLINQDIQTIDGDLAAMDQHVATITNGVGEMAWRFDQLIHTTRGMGYNVNQMSQPVRTLDPFGIMGR